MVQQPLFDYWQSAYNEGSFSSISHLHKETHLGNAYKLCAVSTAATNSTTLYVQINGSTLVEGHLKSIRTYISDGIMDVKLIDISTASTHVAGNVAMTAYNRKMSSTNESRLEFYSNPTLVNSTLNGNVVKDRFFSGGGGTNQQSVGGQLSQEDEWVIDGSTYIISIEITTTAATCIVDACLTFYEEA